MDKQQLSESENSINEIDKNSEADDEESSLPNELENVFTDLKILASVNMESVAKYINHLKENWNNLNNKIGYLEKYIAKNYQSTFKEENTNELRVSNRILKMQNETLEKQNAEYIKINEMNEKKIDQLMLEKYFD